MRTFSQLLVIALFAHNALAGPACARRMRNKANCIAACASRWGWPGSTMGSDPWGAVMMPKGQDGKSGLAYACGETTALPASASSTLSSIAPRPTVVQNPAPAPGEQETTTAAVIANTTASVTSSTATQTNNSTTVLPTSSAVTLQAEPTTSTSPPPPPSARPSSSTPPPPPSSPSPSPSPRPSPSPQPSPQPSPSPNPAPAPAPSPNPPPSNSNSGTSSSDIGAYLAGHNNIRAQHGAAPLTWSNDLAAKAQQWANGCVFQHSGGSLGRFGENLAAGTGNSYNIAAAIKSWTDEVSEYNPNNPVPSHFTQVVWKGTSQVGCAMQLCDGIFAASFGKAKYFVCEYSAPGNVIGQFAQNVQV